MAEETHTVEKHYCYDHPSAYHNDNALIGAIMSQGKSSGCDQAALMSMMNNQNSAWNNNPFVYLVWMMMMRWMNGNWNGEGGAENFNSRQIAALQDSVNTNHNNDIALQAINGNTSAINQLSQTFNCDFNTMSQAICGIKSAIEQVGGQIGYSAESVKNAIALGDANMMQQMQNCCCQQKQLIIEQGYQNQLANERQTNTLGMQINDVRQAVVNGFANIGYQNEKNTASIIQNATANTQRVLDQLCANNTQELRDKLADKDRELQTQTLLNQLKASCGCNCSC